MQFTHMLFYKLLPFAKFFCIFFGLLVKFHFISKEQFYHLRAVARLQNEARQVSSTKGASR